MGPNEYEYGALRVYECLAGASTPVFLFVHGGPGSHCHYVKTWFADAAAFQAAAVSWVFYDQRNCGKAPAASAPTHADNVDDLKSLLKHCQAKFGARLAGVVGHSYGGWLAYDAMLAAGSTLPAILLAINADRTISRNRNFMIEMIEAKIRAAAEYGGFLKTLPAEHFPDAWREKDRLRSVSYARDLRRFFYWADLDAMARYEAVKAAVGIPESDATFISVRDTFFAPPIPTVDMERLAAGSLRIVGFQDFMMAGESASAAPRTRVFLRSGHYPHIEQSDDFLTVLREVAQGTKGR